MGYMTGTHTRIAVLIAVAAATGAVLAGCTSTPTASSTTSAASAPTTAPSSSAPVTTPAAPVESSTPTAAPTATKTPTATATPAAPTDAGTAIGLTCRQLISDQTIYAFNPNYSLKESYTPKSGTRALTIKGYNGLTCEWINQSSNEKIDVSVAHVSSATLKSIRANLKASATKVSTFGGEGYFSTVSGVGQASVIQSPYWVTVDSATFDTSPDAQEIMADALASLK
jgi:hypothetical protein